MSNSDPRRIQTMPTPLANQIAAGEVIERPASVVKELLENSIDAGASSVDVVLEQGGVRLIRVVDNGNGIHCDDLLLAVAPHATSKLLAIDDLEAIRTLGFRGEALASIASVARFSLTSRQLQSEIASGVSCTADGCEKPQSAAHPVGTSAEVRDLFYATPARRKFLRSERTEFLHCEETVKRIALSCPDVSFRLHHNGRRIFHAVAAASDAERRRRVAALLGQSFLATALPVAQTATGLQLRGWLTDPREGRAQGDATYFFLNGRVVRDRLLSHAVRLALQGYLPAGRQPGYLLYLEVDPREVDVNVHPTKHEVRFRQTRMIHDFVFSALQRAVGQEEGLRINEADAPAYRPTPLQEASRPRSPAQPVTQLSQRQPAARSRDEFLRLEQRYLLLKGEAGLRLVDLWRLDRQLNLIRMHTALLEEGRLRGQPLLFPLSHPADRTVLAWLTPQVEWLAKYGIEITPLSVDSVALRQVPQPLRDGDQQGFLDSLLELRPEQTDEASLLALIARYGGGYTRMQLDGAAVAQLVADLADAVGAGEEPVVVGVDAAELAERMGLYVKG